MKRAEVVIVGGGIAGLAAAHRAVSRLGDEAVLLVEQSARLGGKIVTERVEGFLIEGGPDSFLASKPAALELCRALDLSDQIREADPSHRLSFVRRDGKLHPLPDGLSGLVPSRIAPLARTRLLSVRGRLRAAMEWLVSRRDDREESVAAFARRRFGEEAYEWLIEPLLSGIYAGDGEALSLEATAPRLRELEQRHGGVLRGLAAARRGAPRTREPTGFLTLAGGLSDLVSALSARIPRVALGTPVVSIQPGSEGIQLALADGTGITAEAVILAIPAAAAAALLDPLDRSLAATLHQIPAVSTATVSLGFRRRDLDRLPEGFGWLSPRRAGGPVVACTWCSNKFPGRAPDGMLLARLFLGRAGGSDPTAAADHELVTTAREELLATHGIAASPVAHRVYRWPDGMPQYTLGHRDRLHRIEERLRGLPGIHLAGASLRGVGIPDCIVSGWAAADAATARVGAA